jgi:uroporphyrinogen-III decarboxylase
MFNNKEDKKNAEDLSTSSNNIGKGTLIQGNIEPLVILGLKVKSWAILKPNLKLCLENHHMFKVIF